MTEARPRPWTGALLGLLLGVVATGLLWLTGVIPPDRLSLFGILAVCIVGAMALTTQRLSAARGGGITVIVIASLLGGVALTGIPEFVSGGALSERCTFQGTSSQEADPVSPADTSALDPFDVTTTDTVEWMGTVPETATEAAVDVGLEVGGFTIPLYSTTYASPSGSTDWGGTVDVASALAEFKDQYAFDLTGTYHFSAQIEGEGDGCTGAGYARVLAPSAFGGVMLAVLWALLAVLLVAIIVVAVVVRRSISHADALAATTSRDLPPEDSIGTGGPIEDDPSRGRTGGAGAAGAAAGASAAGGGAARRDDDAPATSTNADAGAVHAQTPPGQAGVSPEPEPEPEPEREPEPLPSEADQPTVTESSGDGGGPETEASAGQTPAPEEGPAPEDDPRSGRS
ncbi:hypothetical protein [Demequina activiva]|uniref:Uncharacterized protein n=1 Tax=Demequina activiva TaxID=1582364 RepID=A0A919Q3S9_9MICO|nr:hypothetical protein [Demequina activiva]GIG55534.1 hypothetical protein Dac01nite_22860 [Demequina activiva]